MEESDSVDAANLLASEQIQQERADVKKNSTSFDPSDEEDDDEEENDEVYEVIVKKEDSTKVHTLENDPEITADDKSSSNVNQNGNSLDEWKSFGLYFLGAKNSEDKNDDDSVECGDESSFMNYGVDSVDDANMASTPVKSLYHDLPTSSETRNESVIEESLNRTPVLENISSNFKEVEENSQENLEHETNSESCNLKRAFGKRTGMFNPIRPIRNKFRTESINSMSAGSCRTSDLEEGSIFSSGSDNESGFSKRSDNITPTSPSFPLISAVRKHNSISTMEDITTEKQSSQKDFKSNACCSASCCKAKKLKEKKLACSNCKKVSHASCENLTKSQVKDIVDGIREFTCTNCLLDSITVNESNSSKSSCFTTSWRNSEEIGLNSTKIFNDGGFVGCRLVLDKANLDKRLKSQCADREAKSEHVLRKLKSEICIEPEYFDYYDVRPRSPSPSKSVTIFLDEVIDSDSNYGQSNESTVEAQSENCSVDVNEVSQIDGEQQTSCTVQKARSSTKRNRKKSKTIKTNFEETSTRTFEMENNEEKANLVSVEDNKHVSMKDGCFEKSNNCEVDHVDLKEDSIMNVVKIEEKAGLSCGPVLTPSLKPLLEEVNSYKSDNYTSDFVSTVVEEVARSELYKTENMECEPSSVLKCKGKEDNGPENGKEMNKNSSKNAENSLQPPKSKVLKKSTNDTAKKRSNSSSARGGGNSSDASSKTQLKVEHSNSGSTSLIKEPSERYRRNGFYEIVDKLKKSADYLAAKEDKNGSHDQMRTFILKVEREIFRFCLRNIHKDDRSLTDRYDCKLREVCNKLISDQILKKAIKGKIKIVNLIEKDVLQLNQFITPKTVAAKTNKAKPKPMSLSTFAPISTEKNNLFETSAEEQRICKIVKKEKETKELCSNGTVTLHDVKSSKLGEANAANNISSETSSSGLVEPTKVAWKGQLIFEGASFEVTASKFDSKSDATLVELPDSLIISKLFPMSGFWVMAESLSRNALLNKQLSILQIKTSQNLTDYSRIVRKFQSEQVYGYVRGIGSKSSIYITPITRHDTKKPLMNGLSIDVPLSKSEVGLFCFIIANNSMNTGALKHDETHEYCITTTETDSVLEAIASDIDKRQKLEPLHNLKYPDPIPPPPLNSEPKVLKENNETRRSILSTSSDPDCFSFDAFPDLEDEDDDGDDILPPDVVFEPPVCVSPGKDVDTVGGSSPPDEDPCILPYFSPVDDTRIKLCDQLVPLSTSVSTETVSSTQQTDSQFSHNKAAHKNASSTKNFSTDFEQDFPVETKTIPIEIPMGAIIPMDPRNAGKLYLEPDCYAITEIAIIRWSIDSYSVPVVEIEPVSKVEIKVENGPIDEQYEEETVVDNECEEDQVRFSFDRCNESKDGNRAILPEPEDRLDSKIKIESAVVDERDYSLSHHQQQQNPLWGSEPNLENNFSPFDSRDGDVYPSRLQQYRQTDVLSPPRSRLPTLLANQLTLPNGGTNSLQRPPAQFRPNSSLLGPPRMFPVNESAPSRIGIRIYRV